MKMMRLLSCKRFLLLTKQAKEVGFKIDEIEFKGSKHKQHEDRHYNKHHNGDNKHDLELG
jgi:hypothetical protein